MTYGRVSNDLYRLATQQIVPAPVTKRQKCTSCARTKSIGQFALRSDVCITCRPAGPGFRRGGIDP